MYRDYVIDAFHRNMPFDQFTTEQLAGDLLPNATDEQRIASGYNRLLMTTREGGAQPKEYLAKYSADRVRNASTVWMGATMGCCECHDHKFDPYSITDFYQFASFFADIQDVAVGVQPAVKMPSRQQKETKAKLDAQIAELQKTVVTQTPEIEAAMQAWALDLQAKLKATPKNWGIASVVDMKSANGQNLSLRDDGSILTAGTLPKHDTLTVVVSPPAGKVSGLRLETLRHESFTKKSLARAPGNGNFVLSGITVTWIRNGDGGEQAIAIRDAVASFEQKGWPVRNALDGKSETGWAVDGQTTSDKDPLAVFRFAALIDVAAGRPTGGQAEAGSRGLSQHRSVTAQYINGRKPGTAGQSFGAVQSAGRDTGGLAIPFGGTKDGVGGTLPQYRSPAGGCSGRPEQGQERPGDFGNADP